MNYGHLQVLPKWTVGGKEIPHNKDGISVLGVLDAKCGMCIRQAAMWVHLAEKSRPEKHEPL